MKINKEIIKNLNPCDDRFNNYVRYYGEVDFTIDEFLNLEKITTQDKIWVMVRIISIEKRVEFARKCADSAPNLKIKYAATDSDSAAAYGAAAAAAHAATAAAAAHAAAYSTADSAAARNTQWELNLKFLKEVL